MKSREAAAAATAAATAAACTIFVLACTLVRLAEGFVCCQGAPPSATRGGVIGGAATAAVATSLDRSSAPSSSVAAAQQWRACVPQRSDFRVEGGRSCEGGDGGVARARGRRFSLHAEAVAATATPGTPRPPAAAGRRGRESVEGAIDANKHRQLMKLQDSLKRFAGLRMWRQALTAFDRAKAEGLPLTSATYTHVINVMSKGGRWKEATQLLEEMIAGGSKNTSSSSGGPKILPSIVSYNAAITACARGRRFEMALDLLRDMHAKSGISPDRYSYAAAMTGLAKAGKPTRALLLLQDMRKAGMTPDFVCLSAAMEACENRGSWKEAAEVLAQVLESEPPPSPRVLTAIRTSAIGACIADGAWEQATDYLADIRMTNGGNTPPASAYAAAANACARAGQGVRARALISELAAGGEEKPTIECYNAVVAGCAIAGDVKGAVRTLKVEVPAAGLKANTKGFNHLMAGCARAGEWKMALELLDELRSGKFPSAPADRDSYNAALDACGRGGQVQPALALLDAMRTLSRSNRRLKPDRYSYAGALQACRTSADYATALELLKSMKADGVRADQRCSLAAVAACAAAGRGAETAEVLEGMVAAGMSTSDGARGLAREACVEAAAAEADGDGDGFERALAALDLLDISATERAEAKAERTPVVPAEAVAIGRE